MHFSSSLVDGCKIMHKAAELMHHYWRMNDKTARGFEAQDDA
jgi:hypothetical protein